MGVGRDGSPGVDGVRSRVLPGAAEVFELVGRARRDLAAEVAVDDVEGEVDAGGQAAGGRDRPGVDVPEAALDLDVRKLHRERPVGRVVRRGRLPGEQAGAREQEGAGTDRHRDVGAGSRLAHPVHGRLAARWAGMTITRGAGAFAKV